MYKLIHQNKVIGYSKLELGDPPMGIVFGEFIPIDDLAPFEHFSSLPNQGERFTRDIDEEDQILIMGLNEEFKVFNGQDKLIDGQSLSIEGVTGEPFQLTIYGISYPFYEKEFPKQCKDYEALYSNAEKTTDTLQKKVLKYQYCNLNIRYDLPDETWDKVIKVYESLPGWIGTGDDQNGEKGIPYWFSFDESKKSISASVEPSGLLISAYNMTEREWNDWVSHTKRVSTAILGFKVGEIELGEVGYEIEWINPH